MVLFISSRACFLSLFSPFVSGVSFGMLDILFEFATWMGVFSEGTPHQDSWGILPCSRFGSHCLTHSITDLVILSLTNLLPILHEIESPSQHLATCLLILYSHRQRLTSRELATFLPSHACHLPLDTTNRRTTRTRTTSLSNVVVDISRKTKPLECL